MAKAVFFTRFHIKLAIVFAALFGLIQVTATLVMMTLITDTIEDEIAADLSYASRVFERLLDQQRESFSDAATVLARDFGFATAVATNERATIESGLLNLASRIDADRAILVDLDHNIIGDVDRLEGEQAPLTARDLPGPDILDSDDPQSADMLVGGAIFDMVIVPIKAPVRIGSIILGVRIDNAYARALRDLMSDGIELSFHVQRDGDLVSAASDDALISAAALMTIAANAAQTRVRTNTPAGAFMSMQVPLSADGATAFVHYRRSAAYSDYYPMVVTVLASISVGLILVFVGSAFLARRATRPLRMLTSASQDAAKGDLRAVHSDNQTYEFRVLTDNFNQMIAAVSEREATIRFQAEHDRQTGLPNRNSIEESLAKHIPQSGAAVLLFRLLELDTVRNTLGYQTAEDMIKLVGEQVKARAGGALVGRVSDTGFAVILPSSDRDTVLVRAQDMMAIASEPVLLDGIALDVHMRCGIALSAADTGISASALLKQANIAAMQAQSLKKTIVVYEAGSEALREDRLSIVSDLQRGMQNGEVFLVYQPKIDANSRAVVGCEALLRWNSEVRGFMPPDEFIPIAEATGFIRELSRWVIDTALAQCAYWTKSDMALNMSINLSPEDLRDVAFVDYIRGRLQYFGVAPERVTFELTENGLIEDPDAAIAVMGALRGLGCAVSIDDFGTGYSSLSYLKALPLDELKIDKSFVLEIAVEKADQAVVEAALSIAKRLGLSVTAEGVENLESVEFLTKHGCDQLQGYYFSRPLPANDFRAFVTQHAQT